MNFVTVNGSGELERATFDDVYLALEATRQWQYERAWPRVLVPLIREGKGVWFCDGVETDEPEIGDWADVTWVCVFKNR